MQIIYAFLILVSFFSTQCMTRNENQHAVCKNSECPSLVYEEFGDEDAIEFMPVSGRDRAQGLVAGIGCSLNPSGCSCKFIDLKTQQNLYATLLNSIEPLCCDAKKLFLKTYYKETFKLLFKNKYFFLDTSCENKLHPRVKVATASIMEKIQATLLQKEVSKCAHFIAIQAAEYEKNANRYIEKHEQELDTMCD